MLVFPPSRELLILVCLLLLRALSVGAGLAQKLGRSNDEYRTGIHDTAENGTNLIAAGKPVVLNVFGAIMSNLLRVKAVNCTRNVRDGVICATSEERAVPRAVNVIKLNRRNLTRTNEIWNGFFGFILNGAIESKVETVKANITETTLPDSFGTNETDQISANGIQDPGKELEFNPTGKSITENTLNGKSRRSVDDQENSAAMFPTAMVADDGKRPLQARPPTAAAEAADAETLVGTMTESVYEGGHGGDEADYYDGEGDYVEDNSGDNKSGDGNDLGEDENSGDRDNGIDGNNSSYCVTNEGDNSGDCDTIESDNSGDGDYTGDSGDNEGSGDDLDEGCGDYSGPDKDDYYDINDYDYDADVVEEAGNDSAGLLGIGDLGGELDNLEKIFSPHFIQMLLEKYYRTQQMVMTISIFETKDIEEYQS